MSILAVLLFSLKPAGLVCR